MKLTPVNKKLETSILSSTSSDVRNKTYNSTSREIYCKIDNEIRTPNWESISRMQRRILNNLKNSSK